MTFPLKSTLLLHFLRLSTYNINGLTEHKIPAISHLFASLKLDILSSCRLSAFDQNSQTNRRSLPRLSPSTAIYRLGSRLPCLIFLPRHWRPHSPCPPEMVWAHSTFLHGLALSAHTSSAQIPYHSSSPAIHLHLHSCCSFLYQCWSSLEPLPPFTPGLRPTTAYLASIYLMGSVPSWSYLPSWRP